MLRCSAVPRSRRAYEPSDLEAFTPYAAAGQLRAQPADDAVRRLAAAPRDVAVSIVRVLLTEDEPLVISLLARISQSKARDLIEAVSSEGSWLRLLPAGAATIAEYGLNEKSVVGRPDGGLARVADSRHGLRGFRQSFEAATIYWSEDCDVQFVTGAIAEYYQAAGGTAGAFGFPFGPEIPVHCSPFGTEGP